MKKIYSIKKLIKELEALQKFGYKRVFWATKDWQKGGNILKVDNSEDDEGNLGEVIIIIDDGLKA